MKSNKNKGIIFIPIWIALAFASAIAFSIVQESKDNSETTQYSQSK